MFKKVNILSWIVVGDHGYVPFIVSTSRSFPHSWLITRFVTRVTRRVSLVEHELITLTGVIALNLGLKWCSCCAVFSSLCGVLWVVVCPFGHCVVCPSIYGFWLPLWYLQTLLYWKWIWCIRSRIKCKQSIIQFQRKCLHIIDYTKYRLHVQKKMKIKR